MLFISHCARSFGRLASSLELISVDEQSVLGSGEAGLFELRLERVE